MLILSAINPEQALSDDEAELMELDLAAVAAGSTEALERLYNTAKAAVYSYSLSVLRNVQDAEDVLHDCFVNIFTAAAGYRQAFRRGEQDRCSSRRGRVQAQGDCFRYGNAACNRSFKISQGNREAP